MKTNNTATIKRLAPKEVGSSVKVWTQVGTAEIMLLPLSDAMRQLAIAQGIVGQAHIVYAELTADILEADRLVIDTIEYDVKGIKKYEADLNVDHLEILIEKRKT